MRIRIDYSAPLTPRDSVFYAALKRLVAQGWVEITGEQHLRRELRRLQDVVAVATRRLTAVQFNVREQLY